ncbi:MAG: hypothetical protein WD355_02440 [Balneolaceae bacterium]
MTPLHRHIQSLNDLSKQILREIRKDQPDPVTIRDFMDQRDESIQLMEKVASTLEAGRLSSDSKKNLSDLFDEFSLLNQLLRKLLHEKLNRRQQELMKATRKKEAEDQYYTISDNPDISYF